MPVSESLPGRVRPIPAENGYETPHSPDSGSQIWSGTHTGERRRNGFAASSEGTSVTLGEGGENGNRNRNRRILIDGHDGTMESRDTEAIEEAKKAIGLRDRIGCYTWLVASLGASYIG